jgi:hypothetical protein
VLVTIRRALVPPTLDRCRVAARPRWIAAVYSSAERRKHAGTHAPTAASRSAANASAWSSGSSPITTTMSRWIVGRCSQSRPHRVVGSGRRAYISSAVTPVPLPATISSMHGSDP